MKKYFKKQPQKTTSEFKFLIRINDEERNPYEIRRKVSLKLSRYLRFEFSKHQSKESEENGIYRYIQQEFKSHFSFLGHNRAYLSNYEEKEGSLIISFTIVIVYSIANYGSIRETIDYFNDDLEAVLRHQSNDFSVSSTITENQIGNNINRNLSIEEFQSLKKQILANRIMVGIIFFLFIVLALNSYLEEQDKVTIDQLENKIDKKIKENSFQEKLDYIYYKETIKDSVNRKSNKKK